MDFEHIFQATSLCPYTEQCDSYRTMANSERWMGKALTRLRREGLSALPREEGGYTEMGLEERLERLRGVKDRCHRHNGRCLRYWQLKKLGEDNESVERLASRIRLLGNMPAQEAVDQPVLVDSESSLYD